VPEAGRLPRLARALLALALLPLPGLAADPDPAWLWQLARLGPFAVAPDGRWLAATVTAFDLDGDRSRSAVWLFDIDGRRPARPLASGGGDTSQPAWHPDGESVFVLVAAAEQPAQLARVRIADGQVTALTRLPVPVRRFRVLADGAAVVFEAPTFADLDGDFERVKARLDRQRSDPTQARISETRILRYWDHYLTDGQVPHLFRLDLDTGSITDLMPGFDRVTGLDGFEWDASADGSALVYSANSTPPPYRQLDFNLYLRRVADGSVRNLTADNPADDVQPLFAPDGTRIAYGRYTRPAVGSDFRRLAVLDLDSGQRRDLPQALASHASDWRFDAGGSRLYFHSERRGASELYVWRGDSVRRLAHGGSTEGVQPGPRGLVYARHDFGAPPDLWLLEPGQDARQVTALNRQRMRTVRMPRVDSVDLTGSNGDRVQMFVAWPPGWRRGGRHPGIVLSHGGPVSAWTDAFSFRWHPALLAARGYVVAMPNFHGSTGFGQAFADSILGNHGERPVADTLAAADWLVQRGGVDPGRIAIAGGSYGGYLTALVTGLSPRFRAAIVHAGVYDIGQQFASDTHWARESAYGDAPWTDPVRLGTWSPSRFVPQMQTPTLILHGEVDYRVPVSQGINLHGALTGKGVPARIVVFPKEHHWIVRPRAAQLWWREVFAWLERWNGPQQAAGPEPAP
jgi:dipeptidyl aminopeptidase/acylaminoacyl peptidase